MRRSSGPSADVPGANTAAGMTKADALAFRDTLLRMREEQTARMNRLTEDAVADGESSNPEEDGTDAFDREFAFKLAGSHRDLLLRIEESLQRIKDGSFGRCEVCGGGIAKARMSAVPFARTCISCQAAAEGKDSRRPRLMGSSDSPRPWAGGEERDASPNGSDLSGHDQAQGAQ